ncbi:hypothetical protein BDR26DRAFT_929392 [Obelidium mucronatum]|nr:hypothetical protein BDR26DRAFT_929392 [Obelidium mucronatum]
MQLSLGLVGVPLRGDAVKRPLRRAPDYENNWNKNYPIAPPPTLFNYKPEQKLNGKMKGKQRQQSQESSASVRSSSRSWSESRSQSVTETSDSTRSIEHHHTTKPSNHLHIKPKQRNGSDQQLEETPSKDLHIPESCNEALASLEDLGVQSLSYMLNDYHDTLKLNQERKSLAARAEYLKQKLFGEISSLEKKLAPHTFGWRETPWTLDMDNSNEPLHYHEREHGHRHDPYVWIGESQNPNNVLESREEAAMWETLRHAEAKLFPLENEEVIENVFDGLEKAMTAEDIDSLAKQWQERPHFENRESPEPEIFKRYNVSSSKKKVEFSSPHSNEEDVDDESKSEEGSSVPSGLTQLDGTETLFSPSQDQTPYGTPYHARSRSIDPDRYVTKEKTISQKRLEADLAAKKSKEEIELSCKFKATPVPASSLLPRYDEIMRKMGNKSTKTRNERANDLMSKVKPFSFSSEGCSADHSQSLLHCKCKSQSNKMIQEMLQEIEKEKQESIKKKSHYLLTAENSLAAHAAEDGRKRREKLLLSQKQAGLTPQHTFRPKLNHAIPDFKTLQTEFERELEMKKGGKPKIVPEPFQGLEEHERLAEENKRKREKKEAKKLERQIKNTEFKATSTPSLLDEKPFESGMHMSKEKEKELMEKIQIRSQLSDAKKRLRASRLRQELQKEERKRAREYKKQLKKIEEKLENRLCLFELVSIENAKRKARREVEQILKEPEILRKRKRTAIRSFHSVTSAIRRTRAKVEYQESETSSQDDSCEVSDWESALATVVVTFDTCLKRASGWQSSKKKQKKKHRALPSHMENEQLQPPPNAAALFQIKCEFIAQQIRSFFGNNPDFLNQENFALKRLFRNPKYANSEVYKTEIFNGINPAEDEHYAFNLWFFCVLSEQNSPERVASVFGKLQYVRDLDQLLDIFETWFETGFKWKPNITCLIVLSKNAWFDVLRSNWAITHGSMPLKMEKSSEKENVFLSSLDLFRNSPTQRGVFQYLKRLVNVGPFLAFQASNDAVTFGAVTHDFTLCAPWRKRAEIAASELSRLLNNGNEGIRDLYKTRVNNDVAQVKTEKSKDGLSDKPSDPFFKFILPLRPVEIDECLHSSNKVLLGNNDPKVKAEDVNMVKLEPED